MSDPRSRDLEEQLAPWVELSGGGPPDWPSRLAGYLALLRDWNLRVNLVSRKSIDRVVDEQLIPSLAAAAMVPPRAKHGALDVGSGGGFPGIPLAILRPEIRIDLVEAARKKTEFLQAAVQVAGLHDAAVHWCRIERPSAALLARAPFDLAFARALGDRGKVEDAVRGLLSEHGQFWDFVAPGTAGSVPWPPTGTARTALRASIKPT